jgi:Na+/H+-translocating membrane pyrophosphatase
MVYPLAMCVRTVIQGFVLVLLRKFGDFVGKMYGSIKKAINAHILLSVVVHVKYSSTEIDANMINC